MSWTAPQRSGVVEIHHRPIGIGRRGRIRIRKRIVRLGAAVLVVVDAGVAGHLDDAELARPGAVEPDTHRAVLGDGGKPRPRISEATCRVELFISYSRIAPPMAGIDMPAMTPATATTISSSLIVKPS